MADQLEATTTSPESMPRMIGFMSSVLERVSESNVLNRRFHPTQKLSVFHSLTTPTISIHSYLQRIFKYADCSPSCFIVAYVYLDRFTQMQPLLPIDSFNVHRLLITSVLVSAKFMDDIVGGISTQEMNLLEVDFLFGLGFQMNVTPATYYTYCSYLQREMLLQSPLQFADSPVDLARRLKLHCSFDEDESTHQKQLAV
ncbi:cyclin-U4-1 isoform X2 [Pyrus x bretschneideri]|uniref:cyclin-U4-1 isoform X2 n=1 Tax=Pyrus x bretschneideri TaxID=225117 RepID=UPI00202F38C6|nr:cyclin-U4-1 isoform X2 [Pyrus x bretschneideri]